MARVLLLSPPQFVRVFYTVDQAVGVASSNKRDDVLLVQFLLRALAAKKDPTTNEPFTPPGQRDLSLDGLCGAQTIASIKHFQAVLGRAGQRLDTEWRPWTDGVVSPVPHGLRFGPIHGRIYLMIRLNMVYADLFGADKHSAIDTDPNFPPELREKLFV